MISYFYFGELIEARQHADQIMALYNEERHRYLAYILTHDPKTDGLVFLARLTWMLGYPDQAVKHQ